MIEERPSADDEQADVDAAPEGASEEARPDDEVTDPDAEQQDPEAGPAAS